VKGSKLFAKKNLLTLLDYVVMKGVRGSSRTLGPEIVFKGDSFAQRPRFLNTVSRENLGSK
jgi:hypothetical protein